MTRAIQEHHIRYEPEETVTIYKGEHKILTLMQWYEKNSVSKGFIRALKKWIRQNESRAEELKK